MDSGSGAVDTTTDNVPAQNATGWYRWNPGTSQTTQLTTIPTTSSGSGCFVDPVGGATGFPAGNWSFTVVTDIPDATLTAGTAVLTVGLWKGTLSGGTWTPTQTILTPTDDPAAQNLRTTVANKTTTVTFALPAFSIAAGETLFVDFWRHQTGGINTGTATRRQLDFYVNNGNAFITHPAADDTAPIALAHGHRAHEHGRPVLRRDDGHAVLQHRLRAGPSASTTPRPTPARASPR